MKKNLIIIGDAATGKTELGKWLDANTIVNVKDGVTLKQIKEHVQLKIVKTAFITNENVTYKDVDKNNFLIIKLQKL